MANDQKRCIERRDTGLKGRRRRQDERGGGRAGAWEQKRIPCS